MTDKINILQINSSNSKFTTHQSHIRKLIDKQNAHISIISESNHVDASVSEEVVTDYLFEGFTIELRINLQTLNFQHHTSRKYFCAGSYTVHFSLL